jgi:hypothetical protein
MMIHCHCSMCRKHHGAAFATFVAAPRSGYRMVSGRDQLTRFASSAQSSRSFCSVCGSVAPTVVTAMDMVICPAGNLQGDLDVRPSAHYFAGSKVRWYSITDQLPQHEEYPPEFAMGGVERPHVEARNDIVDGSCLCGEIAFEATGSPVRVVNCHCSRCRRGRSAAHATNYLYPLDHFRFTRGEAQLATYRVSEAKFFAVSFCTRCGGALPRISSERGFAVVPGGALDTDPHATPTAHIFVGSKANWFDITDQLPQFEGMLT